ncbi:MAG: S8 family serine peptidase [Eubacterium sp.]|nr:S8 family serine peptidase [Eubacterium sp.]
MKRFISIILSIAMLLLILSPFYVTINTQLERKSIFNFCNNVSQLNEKYDSDADYMLKNETGDNNIALSANRLVVKTEEKIEDQKAIDSVCGLDWAVLQYENKGDMLEAYERLSSLGYTVEKDRMFYLNDAETDSFFPSASRVSSDYSYVNSGANYIKSLFNGNDDEIVVGIMDSGIDYKHTEFIGRYVDNSINFSTTGMRDDPMDDLKHGTACASVVVRSTPNNVKVKPYKIFNSQGTASLSTIVAAVEYVLAEKDKPDIMNMSFNGYELDGENEIQNELAARLVESGIIVCVSAGNEAAPSEYASPSGCEDVITVASHNYAYEFSSFSDYGSAIDITAPGENIYAAMLGGGYASDFTGTSFSAPFVSAACAYVLMQNPDYTPIQVKEKIKSSAVYMGEDDSYYYGSGVLSFINLIDDMPYQPLAPSTAGGLYHDTQTIEFDNIPDGTKLIYTTDRTVPSLTNGTVYKNAITVDSDTQFNYVLVDNDGYVSPVTAQHYIIQYYAKSSDFVMINGVITSVFTTKKNIVVPELINGKRPTGLVASLFRYSSIESIVLPDSITDIGMDCFYGAKNLKHIIANGVTAFNGDNVFYDCVELRDVSMPKLKTITASAFKNCSKLHKIDFGENLTEFKNSLFSGSGLMVGYFPNVKMNDNTVKEVFKDCPLSYCYIPNVTSLSEGLFNGCKYLNDLTIGKVNSIYSKALAECSFINKLDTSDISTIGTDALYSCYLDVMYAPKCKALPLRFGQYCYVRVIDLPNASGFLGSNMLNCSTTEELYLDSASNIISSSAMKNVVSLRIIYLPNVISFYGPYTKVSSADQLVFGDYWEKVCPVEIIWIPRANIKGTLNLTSLKIIFAPSTCFLDISFASTNLNAKIVLSDKVVNGNISINNTGTSNIYNNAPTIIAPDGSYAQLYAKEKKDYGFKFVSINDCIYTGVDEQDNFVYSIPDDEMRIPYDYILPCWNEDAINKDRNMNVYEFLLDLTNDNVINAKDYSVLLKDTKLAQLDFGTYENG